MRTQPLYEKPAFVAGFVFALSTLLLYLSYTSFKSGEASFFFAVPLCVYSFYVDWKRYASVAALSLISIPLLGLSPWLNTALTFAAFLLAHFALNRLVYYTRWKRLLCVLGLSAVFALVNPTLPTPNTFVILPEPWGAFIIAAMNIGSAIYATVTLKRIRHERKEIGWASQGRSELFLGLVLLLASVFATQAGLLTGPKLYYYCLLGAFTLCSAWLLRKRCHY